MISFIKTGDVDPLKEYQLILGNFVETDIYWPTKELHSFMDTTISLEVEAAAIEHVTNLLVDLYPPLKFDYGRTRLEVSLALYTARHKIS